MESILSSASKKFIVQQDASGLLQVLPLEEEAQETNVAAAQTATEGEDDHE